LEYALDQKKLDEMDNVLKQDIIDTGVHCVCLIDLAGNVITSIDNGEVNYNIYSLAALAAGNFGAVNAMAKLIGEEEFSLLFHKGQKENIYFSKIAMEFLLIVIFGKETSLGFLRLKVDDATEKIKNIIIS
jgi:predicted regulator of Ras-like GTPase activity (Roadblock/LC7/MglB family)